MPHPRPRTTSFFKRLATAVVAAIAVSAEAQTGGIEELELEEVIVTAQFREENLQNVAVAMTAFDGKRLEGLGITDIADILRRVPGVDLYSRGPNKSDVSIRGLANLVSQTDFQRTSNLTGFYMDGVSVAVTYNSQRTWNLFDMDRVEVLRGPQGTLYGEGAMGGAIRYETRSPNLEEFEALFSGTLSTTDGAGDANWSINGTVNIPISKDKFGIRVTGFVREDAGFINYVTAGVEDANKFKNAGFRAVGLLQINDQLSVRLNVTHEESTSESEWTATEPVKDLENLFHPLLEPALDDVTLVSAQIHYNTQFGTFSSISGYFDRSMDDLGLDPTVTGAIGLPTDKTFLIDYEAFSEELRFVSNLSGPFSFLAGAYFKHSKQGEDLDEQIVGPVLPGAILIIDEAYDGKQYSFFGEASYEVSEKLTLTAGLRYFREKVDSAQVWTEPEVIFTFIPTNPFTSDITISKVLPKFVVDYQPNEDVLLYAGASRGARNGGLNVTSTISFIAFTGTDTTPFRTFKEDSVWSYEVGAKTQWLDRKLTVNLAGYYLDWTNMQVLVASPPLPFFPNGIGFVGNGETARTIGAEIEINYAPNSYTHFFFSGNVADAEITTEISFNQTLGTVVPAGSPIPGVADWTFNTGVDLIYPLGEMLGGNTNVVARLNYQRFAKMAGNITTGSANAQPNFNIPEYGLLNLRLGLEFEKWSVTLFANNVANEIVPLYQGFSNSGFFINKPRVFGLTVNTRF